MASAKTTTNHDEIKKWAEDRGAKPSTVKRTHSKDDPGIIRLNFPGYSGEQSLEEISWEEWFRKFDEQNLALLYQEETKDGQKSNFNKLVNRSGRKPKEGSSASTARARSTSSRSAAKGATSEKKTSGAKKTPARRTTAKK